MKKTLTFMLVGMLAAACLAQPTPPTSGDGTLPTYEQKPGWFNNGNTDATANPANNPENAGGGRRRWRQNGQNRQNAPWNNGNGIQNGPSGQNGQNGQGRHGRRWARFDTNGDGQLDAGEKAAAKAQVMQRFDTDGDGQLSQQERQAIRQMRGQNGQGGGRHRRNGQMHNGQPNSGPFQNPNPGGSTSPSPSNEPTSRGGPFG